MAQGQPHKVSGTRKKNEVSLTPHQKDKSDKLLTILEKGNAFAYFEMRAGKTPTIYDIINRRTDSKILILTEKNLKPDMLAEAGVWLKRDLSVSILNKKEVITSNICIAHNQQLKTHAKYIKLRDFDFVFIDECGNFKNYYSVMTQRLHSFNFKKVLLLSGTPADKNFHWLNILKFCLPDGIGHPSKESDFLTYFCKAYWEKLWKGRVFRSGGSYNIPELMTYVAKFTVRSTTKDSVGAKQEQSLEFRPIEPPEGMIDVEDEMLSQNLVALKLDRGLLFDTSQDEELLAKLKKFTVMNMEDIPEEYRTYATVSFSDISKQRVELSEQKLPEILKSLVDLDLLEPDTYQPKQKFLLYGYYRTLLESLHEEIQSSVLFYGGMTPKAKEEAKRQFKDGEADVFICNYVSGGKGLSLPEATVTVMIDFPWNSSDMRQVSARTLGINQKNKTRFILLPMRGTIDMQVLDVTITKDKTISEYESELDNLCE